ncbi:hypothetical protein X471_01206 [Bartonella bacilliformis str. Heidi Mejia]|nr:hypothetical protein X471_01206 [Bartonella bacilliformis str. Heidi Mejia]KEG16118.1 hypothetical protein H705_01044 [Bartonella bacilliformis Cond044]KEG18108.1 hypothetical protein H707_00984 [Bartonella bacilliformis Hosp800-02]KEG23111.1 hypothetical protein H706_00999 [Bartonella bacilliformis CAR600-02]
MRIIYNILLMLLLAFPTPVQGSMEVSNLTSDVLSFVSIVISLLHLIAFIIFL